jgi:hypothetical protein
MIKHIKTETNRYAKPIADKLRRTKKLKPHSIWHTWTAVKLHEMFLFFAVIIHMCLVKKQKIRDYWSTSSFIYTPFSESIMSRNAILQYFQICMSMTMQHTFPEINVDMNLCTKLDSSWIIC